MTTSILDFKMTTIIDTRELIVMVKGQLGKGRFWCRPSMRIIAIREASMIAHARTPFHQYPMKESANSWWNSRFGGGGWENFSDEELPFSPAASKVSDVTTGFDEDSSMEPKLISAALVSSVDSILSSGSYFNVKENKL